MKKITVTFMICCCALCAGAQQFATRFTLALPDSVLQSRADWVDLDNDGLLDILLLAESNAHEDYLMFVKGDTVNTPVLHLESLPIVDVEAYCLVDYNRDNAMDIVISGLKAGAPVTVLYQNLGGFNFNEVLLPMPAFTRSIFADLNNDARREWVMTGGRGDEAYLLAFSEDAAGSWKPLTDTVAMAATALEIVDADYNGVNDLFVSGQFGVDSLYTGFLVIHSDTLFTPYLGQAWMGAASVADMNADGALDVVFSGVDRQGVRIDKIWSSGASSYTLSNAPVSLADVSIFLGDLDSDGVVDFSLRGKNAAGDTLHLIRYATQDFDTLDARRVAHHAFGDAEHDGDLDMLQVVMEHTPVLRLLENQAAVNQAPVKPQQTMAVGVFDRTFVYWTVSSDDHTPERSITYDVFFQAQGQETQVGEFDLANDMRLVTGPGNNGSHHFKLLKNIGPGTLNYIVQAVDNSFHAHAVCLGSGGGGTGGCVTVEPQVITTCRNAPVQLPGSSGTLWFSFALGFVGELPSLELAREKQDTVFSFNPALGTGCDALKTYVIEIKDTIQEPPLLRYACQDAMLSLTAGPARQNAVWTSDRYGDLGTLPTLNYLVQQADSIFVVSEDRDGCKYRRATAIVPSIPQVGVVADHYKITRGNEVQLQATGALRYMWAPSADLDRTDIANPVARPEVTTLYTVTGYDSLDCSAMAQVTIIVEGAGFIPNLFTPNGDGKNDQLKVYGLTSASGFSLTISNREGSVVFHSTDVADVLNRGWDGTRHGVKQPSGVYFWKVKGQAVDGTRLLLNGKESGSIVLIH